MEKIFDELMGNVKKIKNDLVHIEICAKDILECVKNEKFIPDELTKDMVSSLNEHNIIKEKCMSLCSAMDEDLILGESITEFESKITDLESKSARKMVSMFFDLHSDDEKIEGLLENEKQKLEKILDETHDKGQLELLVKDYVVFAETINEINDKDPAELMSMISTYTPTFGSELTVHAFALKDIYVRRCEEVGVVKAPVDGEAVSDMLETSVSDELSSSEKEVANTEDVENKIKDIICRNNVIIPEGHDYGFMNCEISSKEEGKIGAKTFRNDIADTKNKKLACDILKTLIDNGCSSYEYLNGRYDSKNLDIVLNYLYSKGYIRHYSMLGKGDFYCGSKRLFKAIQLKDVYTSLSVKPEEGNPDDFLENKESIVLCRIGYSYLVGKRCQYEGVETLSTSKVMLNEVIAVEIVVNKKYRDLIISAVMTNYDDLEFFEQWTDEYMKREDKPSHVICVSADKTYSTRLANAMKEILSIDENECFYYSFEEDSLYNMSNNVVSFDDIWTVSDDDTEMVESIDSKDDEYRETEEISEINSDESLFESEKTIDEENDEESIADDISDNVAIDNDKHTHLQDDALLDSTLPAEEIIDEKVDINEVLANAYEMINAGKLYCALPYLYSFTKKKKDTKEYDVWRKFAYATNDPIKSCRFSSTKMYDLYLSESTSIHDYLLVSASLRTFFYNNVEYDYQMKSLYEGSIQNLSILNDCIDLKNAFRTIMMFKDTIHKGMNEYADYRMQDNVNLEKKINEVKSDAKKFYEERILGKVKESVRQERFVKTKKIIFDKKGDIAEYLQVIVNEDKELYPVMRDYICETFMKESSEANVVNIDKNKMDAFMDEAWEKAGKTMRYIMKSSDLMGSLRRNLEKSIISALKIMCESLSYSSRYVSGDDDKGLQKYKKDRNDLLKNLEASKVFFENNLSSLEDESSKAGCNILVFTIDEIIRRINGNYSEDEYKYFYIDFLKADMVLLDNDYLPVMDMNFKTPKGLGISDRILDHSTMELGTFEERLEEIFMDHGDDFGSAKLIIDYLGDYGQKLVEENNYNLEESVKYGKRGAENNKQEFIENLELMQSYGQIDNTVENKKDKYLQIANAAYDFCYENNNFGFYKSVIDAFIDQIKKDSKKFEDAIVVEFENYKKEINNKGNSESILSKLDDVQKMLDNQNYTVAQDLLTRIKKGDLDTEISILPEDYLEDFIDQYDHNVSRTADSSKSLINVVSHKLRNPKNKDTNGGRRLIDNWPKTGHSLDSYGLKALLGALGFNVEDVTKSEKIGKIDNYNIKLTRPANGRKVNYKHPIAAFGSIATSDDFRVAFLPGKTDADRLIMAMKELGNAKHTILIVDYAIDLRDRRKLARKIKELNPVKVFGVIDRVMILFLAENYNESYINQMLMSIMMPFSYVQPYVWESGYVMPPEIFMGRDKELKDIESPTGVNIVYGGRQLGKSALLKMARNDIDNDENGRRAVYIDIKGKDYRQVSRIIGQTLHDEGILEKDYKECDWDELSRDIKTRLSSNKKKIPYLLLLLDEADVFIESCSEVNFSPFDALKDIQNVGTERFKFVIAGLRNIVKFSKGALSNNSVLTHLSHTTIVPFNYNEARELLEKPLYYLGLRFPKEKDSLVSLIFANANYFPGLIQLYCAKLVEAMTKGDYAGYNENDAPIYYVEQEHIKKVLAEEGFLQQVREKFEITLRLDEDNYYYIIALLMASLYHDNGYSNGYSADDVWEEGCSLDVKKIVDTDIDKINVFMDELCELNVLRRLADDRYVFNRYNFFQMMGSREEIDDKLLECMEG